MSAAPLADRRTLRAAAIVQAGDVHESKPGVWRVRDQAGSGAWHYVSSSSCDCIDFQRTGLRCKHLIALANWAARNEPTCPTCGGATHPETRWAGKAGWLRFHCCISNREHKAVRI